VLEHFFLASFQCAIYIFFGAVSFVLPVYHKEFALVVDVLVVNQVRVAFAERQVIHGVEHIGLAHAVVADETIYFRRKFQFRLHNVFVVDYGNPIQLHIVAKVAKIVFKSRIVFI
jgi:hypothetical protein